jgi:hypothetical protein
MEGQAYAVFPFAASIKDRYGKESLRSGFTPMACSIVLDMQIGNR